MKKVIALHILCIALAVVRPMRGHSEGDSASEGKTPTLYKNEYVGVKNPLPLPPKQLPPVEDAAIGLDNWYFRLAASAGYYRMGPEIERAFQQIEDFFSGKTVHLSVINFDTKVSMKAAEQVKRAETSVLPMSDIGFGVVAGKHRFELSLGIAGMVSLNTIDADTPMTIYEDPGGNIDERPMAKLGFVNETTGIGYYHLQAVMNEEVWIVAPSCTYDITLFNAGWGALSAGGGISLVIIAAKQDFTFKAERTDLSGAPYSSRILEGKLQSTAANDIGPRATVHLGYRKRLGESMMMDIRLGVSAGYVDVHREVDGGATIFMGGDALPVSFPLSSITVGGNPIKSSETNRIELMGIFIQAGLML